MASGGAGQEPGGTRNHPTMGRSTSGTGGAKPRAALAAICLLAAFPFAVAADAGGEPAAASAGGGEADARVLQRIRYGAILDRHPFGPPPPTLGRKDGPMTAAEAAALAAAQKAAEKLPVRLTFDNNYFNALYQGIPVGGYTKLVANMLEGIEVRLGVDYLENREELDPLARRIVYTGPVDAFFGYRLGYLEYRSVRFETEVLDMPNFQGNAAVNYTDRETPWTRIIEHKWFEFGKDAEGNELPKTVISREYSAEWKPGDEPYYPVNDEKNGALYAEYKKLAEQESRIIFGGRLGEYKYYDMDAVIASALAKAEEELGRR